MRSFVLLLAAIVAVPVSAASSERDELGGYVNCLVESKAQAPSMSKAYHEACLRRVGIEDAGEDARRAARQAWRSCLAKKLAELDDGISPAPDVARAVLPLCSDEWRDLVASLPLPSGFKQDMADNVQKHGLDEGVRAVLRERKKASANHK